ncbi:MAG: cyclic nucleotide-binding domain-containing protein [Chloroflexota bacterium]|nr:cyclic nucleotide-binding domain-containing protein [Chloroflexota bacterium]
MSRYADLLADHLFFEGMDRDHLESIASCASETHFSPGKFILREGREADRFYLIFEGAVALEVHVPQFGPLTIEMIEGGDVLG